MLKPERCQYWWYASTSVILGRSSSVVRSFGYSVGWEEALCGCRRTLWSLSPHSSQGFCSKLGSPPQASSVSERQSENPLGIEKHSKDQTPQHKHHTALSQCWTWTCRRSKHLKSRSQHKGGRQRIN